MWYWPLRVITLSLFKLLFRLRVEGRENLPAKTNFIVAANHTSFLDPFVVGLAIPKRIYWLALREFHAAARTRWFMLGTNTLAAGRSSDTLINLLTRNKNVGLFPEGTRSHDGRLKEFRRGAAMLAMRTGRPIVPCAIIGAYEALPPKAGFPKLFSPIKVRIGRPQYLLKEFDDVVDDIHLQEGTFRVKNNIQEMIHAG